MGVLGSTIGGALGIGGSIFGGISASKAMRKVKENLENQVKDNQNWLDRRYNEDATQRADAQRILTMVDDGIRQRNKAAAGVQAVAGGTEESVASEKAANNRAMADAASQIAAAGDRRKDQIEAQYMRTRSDLNERLNDMEQAKAASVAEAVKGVAEVGAALGDLF